MKVAVYIDNDLTYVDEMSHVLNSLGYKLHHVATLEKAREIIAKFNPKIIFCEVDLADGDGISFCYDLRKDKQFSRTPILLFSTKADAYIQVLAFESGVDDYLVKPFNKRLVLARLKSLLRRTESGGSFEKATEFNINREKFLVEHKGREITLPRKEFEILALLFSHKGMVFNRDKIKEEVWIDKGRDVNSRTVDVHIKNIRELIGAKFIKTVKGVGYKFAG